MNLRVTTIEELAEVIRRYELTTDEVNNLLGQSIKVWFVGNPDSKEMSEKLIRYWHKWKDKIDRPLFITPSPQ